MELLLAEIAIAASWIALAVLLCALGLACLRLIGVARESSPDIVAIAPAVGLSATIAILQVWHIWLAISSFAALLLLALALAALAFERRTFYSTLSAIAAHRRAVLVAAALFLFLANRAVGPGDAFDSGSYQYALIRWANTYPLVPGLGNLHETFGNNNASLLWHALLNTDISPWHGRANHIGNGIWLMLLAVVALTGLSRVWRRHESPTITDVYAALLLAPLMMMAFSREVSSPRTDLPAAVTSLLAVWQWLQLLHASSATARRTALILIVVLSGTLVCLKLSTAPLVAALCIGALIIHGRHARPAWRDLVLIAAILAVLIGTWSARGIVLTGYPLYPSSLFAVDVDWRMPQGEADALATDIREMARVGKSVFAYDSLSGRAPEWIANAVRVDNTEQALRSGTWLRTWMAAVSLMAPVQVLVPVLITAVAIAAVARVGRLRKLWLVILPALLASIAWMALAPEPRFGYGALWGLALAATAVTLSMQVNARQRRAAIVTLCIGTALIAATHRATSDAVVFGDPFFSAMPFFGAGEDHGLHPLPRTDDIPWDGPLMTMPSEWGPPHYRLRSADGKLERGFASSRR